MNFRGQELVICLLAALFGVSCVIALSDIDVWNEYKINYEKNYTSPEEEEYRMKVFFENKRRIESYNTRSTLSFVQGINSLSDLTTEEINNSRNGFKPSEREPQPIDGVFETLLTAFNITSGNQSSSDPITDKAWYDHILGRDTLDWRTSGRVSRVKDQGSCGSCWAFSVTGALEAYLASQNKDALLSEQNLVDCSRKYGNEGCSGGWMEAGLSYVRDNGIMLSSDYPYLRREDTCRFDKSKSVLQVRGSVILPRGNELLLRIALALTGPMPVAVDASQDSFHSYKSGIYHDRSCRSGFTNVNHAVLLVGYGTDPIHGDYWILKNSWGRRWGHDGYMKLARNRGNQCGIASYAVLPIF